MIDGWNGWEVPIILIGGFILWSAIILIIGSIDDYITKRKEK
jgi:hypothetical protein